MARREGEHGVAHAKRASNPRAQQRLVIGSCRATEQIAEQADAKIRIFPFRPSVARYLVAIEERQQLLFVVIRKGAVGVINRPHIVGHPRQSRPMRREIAQCDGPPDDDPLSRARCATLGNQFADFLVCRKTPLGTLRRRGRGPRHRCKGGR